MMPGHEKSDLVIVAMKPANKAKKAPCGGVCGGGRSGVGGAKGGGQGEYAPAKHVLDSEPGVACQRRWSVYGDLCRYPPEAGAVCGKAERFAAGSARAARRQGDRMKRRKFITLLGGAAAWPLAARAQERDRMRRIAMLWIIAETDPQAIKNREAFIKQLHKLGWRTGENVQIDHRWAAVDADRQHAYAAELVRLGPDLIVAEGTPGLAAAQLATRTVPIVFVNVTDPVGQGFVESLARPRGNATGFALFEFSMGTKWLEILRELMPSVKKVGFMFNPAMALPDCTFARSNKVPSPTLLNPSQCPWMTNRVWNVRCPR